MKNFILIIGFCLFAGLSANAQSQTVEQPTLSPRQRDIVDNQRRQQRDRDFDRLRGVKGDIYNRSRMPGLPNRNVELTERDKRLISLSAEDKAKYSAFLQLPDTGFFRLHDAADCEEEKFILNAADTCPWNVEGKGTAYSFRREEYRTASFSDIRFNKSNFQIVGTNLLGFLTDLGDTALDKLTIQSDGVKEMADFEPSVAMKEVEKQTGIVKEGFKIGGFTYRASQPVKENTTYALRAIAYQSKLYQKVNGFKINLLEGDKRVDVTIVFRVIRVHEDGSVSILWKELSRKDAPKLIEDKKK